MNKFRKVLAVFGATAALAMVAGPASAYDTPYPDPDDPSVVIESPDWADYATPDSQDPGTGGGGTPSFQHPWVAVVGGYGINTYTDLNCSIGHRTLYKGQGHQSDVHSVRVNAVGWFQTNVPGKTGRYSFGPANACKKINYSNPNWFDTHINAYHLGN